MAAVQVVINVKSILKDGQPVALVLTYYSNACLLCAVLKIIILGTVFYMSINFIMISSRITVQY